jgi:hypothetical protein
MLADLRPDAQIATAASVGSWFASQDARAAAQWALDFADADVRSATMAAVTRSWVARDAPAARAWTLALPRNSVRDQALSELFVRTASTNFDATLLDAFSSDAARDDAIVRACHPARRPTPSGCP